MVGLLLALGAGRAGVTPMRAQQVVTPSPGANDDLETVGPYTISNSFEAGYRLSDVSGNRDVYRSSVNFGNGMRLFEGQLRINTLQGRGKYFDEFAFHTFGAGQDPYQATSLRVEKNSLYRYDMRFRIVNYFNRLPSLWNGEHGVNSERIVQNHDLTLFPGRRVEIWLGYDRSNHNGPGFSSEAIANSIEAFDSGNFLRLATDLRQLNNQYRTGTNIRVAGLAITLTHSLDNYREDTEFSDASGLAGGLGNVQAVSSLRRHEPIHGNTPVTGITIRTENENVVGFHGRYVYSGRGAQFRVERGCDGCRPGEGFVDVAPDLCDRGRESKAGDRRFHRHAAAFREVDA